MDIAGHARLSAVVGVLLPLIVAGCGAYHGTPPSRAAVTGSVTYRERSALPPDAVVREWRVGRIADQRDERDQRERSRNQHRPSIVAVREERENDRRNPGGDARRNRNANEPGADPPAVLIEQPRRLQSRFERLAELAGLAHQPVARPRETDG